MSNRNITYVTSADFFEAKYRTKPDPWNFSGSDYEQQRYKSILKILDNQTYHYAYEPGCSIGILTRELATRCDYVEAIDFSETAVQLAKKHCDGLNNVTVLKASIREYRPAQRPDLIILSEIGYYFTVAEWTEILENLISYYRRPATLIACHWLGKSEDHVMSGDEVHKIIDHYSYLNLITRLRFDDFRLDRWDLA